MTDDHPTCDLCGAPGYARYRHCYDDRWIDVCGPHKPAGSSSLAGYHTVHNRAYPAERLAHVTNPRLR